MGKTYHEVLLVGLDDDGSASLVIAKSPYVAGPNVHYEELLTDITVSESIKFSPQQLAPPPSSVPVEDKVSGGSVVNSNAPASKKR